MILNYVIKIMYYGLSIFTYIIFASILLTWVPGLYEYKIPRMIRTISDWYMWPFRGFLVLGIIDFTPIIGVVLLETIVSLLGAFI